MLQTWEGEAAADSGAAAVYYVAIFGHVLRELFPEARFGALAATWRFAWFGLSRILTAQTSPWFPGNDEKDAMLLAAFARAAQWCAARMGPDPSLWTWGALHEFAPRHPLAAHESFAAGGPAAWPAPGSPFTVLQHRAGSTEPPYPVVLSPAVRMVADLSTDVVHLALPTGESGRVASPHLVDQLEAWRSGGMVAVRLGTDTMGEITELVPG